MNLPNTRIGFSRSLARMIAAEAKQEAGLIAAESVRLIRDHHCSPAFAARHARARALAMMNGGRS